MTKCIVIGSSKIRTELVPIVFNKALRNPLLSFEDCSSGPCNYNFIELICKDYILEVDLMFAYNDPVYRSCGTLYVGKWNDGIVK